MDRNYQLVLQLPEDCPLEDLEIEDDLAEAVGNPGDDEALPHLVDGNSYGAGTIEIFIHTADPVAAFDMTKGLLAERGLLDMVTAAYRQLSKEIFTVIWPTDHEGEFSL